MSAIEGATADHDRLAGGNLGIGGGDCQRGWIGDAFGMLISGSQGEAVTGVLAATPAGRRSGVVVDDRVVAVDHPEVRPTARVEGDTARLVVGRVQGPGA